MSRVLEVWNNFVSCFGILCVKLFGWQEP